MSNLLNPDYKKFYGIYKKLPGILAIFIAALFFIWSIVDLSVFSDDGGFYGGYFHSPSYGIMELESPILVLLIWWTSGATTAACTWFFSVLVVSATVARTDATIELNEKINNTNTTPNNSTNTTQPIEPKQPTQLVQPEQPQTPSQPAATEQPKTVEQTIEPEQPKTAEQPTPPAAPTTTDDEGETLPSWIIPVIIGAGVLALAIILILA